MFAVTSRLVSEEQPDRGETESASPSAFLERLSVCKAGRQLSPIVFSMQFWLRSSCDELIQEKRGKTTKSTVEQQQNTRQSTGAHKLNRFRCGVAADRPLRIPTDSTCVSTTQVDTQVVWGLSQCMAGLIMWQPWYSCA